MIHDERHLLAPFQGNPPPAPDWYVTAMAETPETGHVAVEGATLEWLAWGPAGAPGVLLVHGGWAHARWWSHIAPLLAQGRRVAALSLSGMGGSDWRPHYAIAQYGRELRAVAQAAGLDGAGPPVLIAHSFGCAPAVAALCDPDDWTAGAILIDGSITMQPGDLPPATGRRVEPFATIAAALARYRLLPPQPCENPFIVDGIARASVRAVEGGLAWAFDPGLYERCAFIDSRAAAMAARRPIAFIRGARSAIVSPATLAGLRADLPGARFVTVPAAGHHVLLDQPLALVAAIDALLAGWI